MTGQLRLDDHLQRYSETAPHALAVAAAVDAIAAAAIEIADLIATGDLADASGLTTGRNSDGDLQRDLDVAGGCDPAPLSQQAADRGAGVGGDARAANRRPRGQICVAIDPLDGSSNIDINMTVGTIFSILPAPDDPARRLPSARLGAARGGLRHLRAADLAGADARRRRRHLHARPQGAAASGSRAAPCGSRETCEYSRSTPRTAAIGTRRSAPSSTIASPAPTGRQPRFQHALDRLAGRGGLPHPHPRRRVPLSLATRAPAMATAACASIYEAHPMAMHHRAGRRLAPRPGASASSTSRRRACISACRWSWARSNEVERVARLHCDPLLVAERLAPLFARRGLFRL